MRLGSQYRLSSFRAHGVQFEGERILDIGCHDGALLASLEGKIRVGVDVELLMPRSGVLMVRADGRHLPFCSGWFDQLIALDVIEHVPDDTNLVREMVRVTRPGGKLFVTAPSAGIRIFPSLLSGWVSARWGHRWRRGYKQQELGELVGLSCSYTLKQWNAPAYRFWYLPLRLLSALWPTFALRVVDWIAGWDASHADGDRGFYWMWCEVKGRE